MVHALRVSKPFQSPWLGWVHGTGLGNCSNFHWVIQSAISNGQDTYWMKNCGHLFRFVRESAVNNLPSGLTYVSDKFIERVAVKRLMNHSPGQQLLWFDQHRFLPKRLCYKLATGFEKLGIPKAAGLHMDVVFADFNKAFDKFHSPPPSATRLRMSFRKVQ